VGGALRPEQVSGWSWFGTWSSPQWEPGPGGRSWAEASVGELPVAAGTRPRSGFADAPRSQYRAVGVRRRWHGQSRRRGVRRHASPDVTSPLRCGDASCNLEQLLGHWHREPPREHDRPFAAVVDV